MKYDVKMRGQEKVLAELSERLEKRNKRAIDRALMLGAQHIVKKLRQNYAPHKKTGALMKEITYSQPKTLNGERTVTIHWRGPKNRYAVVHLVEWGTIAAPNPPQKGVIERTLRETKEEYRQIIKRELGR